MSKSTRPLRITMLGLRSFPHVQGGVETHAKHLCPLLVELGCNVEVLVRAPYHSVADREWHGVHFTRLWAPRSKGLEALLHSLLGVLYAGFVKRPDILHIQAIGPALVVPLARLLGLKVVVTHHGPDYDRQKWGRFAKWALRVGERFGMRYSHERIVISKVISDIVQTGHKRHSKLIPNGVALPALPTKIDALMPFGLQPGRYVVLVSRLVPEKRHLDLIAAFAKANLNDWKLAIVGASDHPDAYVQQVVAAAKAAPNVVCTGLQTGEALAQLYGHAAVFVLPSSHEGLPIAMLEALSFGLPVIASDIPANVEVGLPAGQYFPLGDVDALAVSLQRAVLCQLADSDRQQRRTWVAEKFDWREIAKETLAVYRGVYER